MLYENYNSFFRDIYVILLFMLVLYDVLLKSLDKVLMNDLFIK